MNAFNKFMFVLILIFALAAGISEPLCRNAARIIFFVSIVMFFVDQRVLNLAIRFKRLLILMLAFTLWIVISSCLGGRVPSTSDSSTYWLYFSYNMLLFIPIALFVKTERRIDWLLIALAVALMVNNIAVEAQLYFGFERPVTFLRGAWMQSALLYVILLPIFLIVSLRAEGRLKKFVWMIFFLDALAAFIILKTRGAWLAMLIVLPAIVPLYVRELKKIFSIGLVLIISALAFFSLEPTSGDRIETMKNFSTEQSVTERFLIWRSSIEMIKDNPILGVGFGNFEPEYQSKYILPEARERWQGHAHNTYLQLWAENGVIGLGLFCALFGFILIQSWRRRANHYAAMIFFSTLGFLLYSLTDYTYASYSAMRVYWFVLALGLRGLDLSVDKRSSMR